MVQDKGNGSPSSIPRGKRGIGRNGGMGPGGNCVCPSCGKKIPHQRGVPCNQVDCPDCGTKMIRE
jgi:hypothetical protein